MRRCWPRIPLSLLVGGLLAVAAPPAPLQASAVSEYSIVSWLRVDPRHPGTVFVGGLRSFVLAQSPDSPAPPTFSCQELASRSLEGGKTWRNLPMSAIDTTNNDPTLNVAGCLSPGPFLVAPGGQELFLLAGNLNSLHSNGMWLERSGDGGLHWSRPLGQGPEENLPISAVGGLSLSPFTPRRIYGYLWEGGGGGVVVLLLRSDDGGAHFRYLFTDPVFTMDKLRVSDYQPIATLQDPSNPSIVYFGFTDLSDTHPMAWARSLDGGKTWHLLNLAPLLPSGALTLNSATANT
ncbi:MAG: sialidase family protein, partial [Chloroflexota bacterium]